LTKISRSSITYTTGARVRITPITSRMPTEIQRALPPPNR
jgi:hypothetical protein